MIVLVLLIGVPVVLAALWGLLAPRKSLDDRLRALDPKRTPWRPSDGAPGDGGHHGADW